MAKNDRGGSSVTEEIELRRADNTIIKVAKDELSTLLDTAMPVTEVVCSVTITRRVSDFNSNSYFQSAKFVTGAAWKLMDGLFVGADPGPLDSATISDQVGILKQQVAPIAHAVAAKVEKCFAFIKGR